MSSVQAVDAFKNFQAPLAATSSSVNTAPVKSISSASSNTAFESLKNNKKAVIGGLAALSLAGIGIAYAVHKHKMPKEIKDALANINILEDEAKQLAQGPVVKMTKEINDITKKMQSKYDEVLELFNKGEEIAPDGTALRKINDNIMSEFSKDGKSLIRETEFVDSLPSCIREFIEGTGKKNIYEFIDGKPDFCQESYETLADHTLKIAKRLNFSDGRPNLYTEDWQKLTDGTRKAAKQLSIEDGRPDSYKEQIECSMDGVCRTAKRLWFSDDGKIHSYDTGFEYFEGGNLRAQKWLDFEDGKPIGYQDGFEQFKDGTQKAQNWLEFVDGKWVKT